MQRRERSHRDRLSSTRKPPAGNFHQYETHTGLETVHRMDDSGERSFQLILEASNSMLRQGTAYKALNDVVQLFEPETFIPYSPPLGGSHMFCQVVGDIVPRLDAHRMAAESSSRPRRATSGGWTSRKCSRELPFPSAKARLCSRCAALRWSETGPVAIHMTSTREHVPGRCFSATRDTILLTTTSLSFFYGDSTTQIWQSQLFRSQQ